MPSFIVYARFAVVCDSFRVLVCCLVCSVLQYWDVVQFGSPGADAVVLGVPPYALF